MNRGLSQRVSRADMNGKRRQAAARQGSGVTSQRLGQGLPRRPYRQAPTLYELLGVSIGAVLLSLLRFR